MHILIVNVTECFHELAHQHMSACADMLGASEHTLQVPSAVTVAEDKGPR